MEWTKERLKTLSRALSLRYVAFREEKGTDRRNLSAIWNRHLENLGIRVVRPAAWPKLPEKNLTLMELVRIINEENDRVAGSLCVPNPDRPGQLMLVPVELAEKVLFVGMP
jgi:hypothetical protein